MWGSEVRLIVGTRKTVPGREVGKLTVEGRIEVSRGGAYLVACVGAYRVFAAWH